jgi:hypothetical protein
MAPATSCTPCSPTPPPPPPPPPCRPSRSQCVQVEFNASQPVLLVADSKGAVSCLKLSPNLQQCCKLGDKAPAGQKVEELEVSGRSEEGAGCGWIAPEGGGGPCGGVELWVGRGAGVWRCCGDGEIRSSAAMGRLVLCRAVLCCAAGGQGGDSHVCGGQEHSGRSRQGGQGLSAPLA